MKKISYKLEIFFTKNFPAFTYSNPLVKILLIFNLLWLFVVCIFLLNFVPGNRSNYCVLLPDNLFH
jgi:hypothetical protein